MKHLDNAVDARNDIVKCLLTGPTLVLFKKKDGSVRKMICTLHHKLIPATKKKLNDMARSPVRSYAAIAAYDLENAGWRSFLVDNVQFFDILKPSEV